MYKIGSFYYQTNLNLNNGKIWYDKQNQQKSSTNADVKPLLISVSLGIEGCPLHEGDEPLISKTGLLLISV